MYKSYIELLKDIDKNGDEVSPSNVSVNRSFVTKELNNVQLEINDFKQMLLDDSEVDYFEKELQWYFDTYEKSAHEKIELSHDKWDKHPVIKPDTFAKDLKALSKKVLGAENRCGENSNYGEMMLRLKNHVGITQMEWVVEKLKKDPQTRQAIAFYNSPNYQYWSNPDFVCALTQMFTIKNMHLNTTINSRSNDLINSFRFDSIWFRIFQKIIYDELLGVYPDLKLGSMFFNIFSAHFYLKDSDKLEKIVEAEKSQTFKSLKSKYL